MNETISHVGHVQGRAVSASTYQNHKCRCDGCRAMHAQYQRTWRAKNGLAPSANAASRAADNAVKWVRANRPDVWRQLYADAYRGAVVVTGHTALPYPQRLEKLLGDAAARCVTLVWDRPGYTSHIVNTTPFGVIEASGECNRRHPSLVSDYVVTAVVWTFDEWKTIEALCADAEEAQQ